MRKSVGLPATLLLLSSLFFGSLHAQQAKPNIIFILSDDHAYQAIGAYGNALAKTPNIDRLAKEGAMFNNFRVTNSICGPSRANLLTGKYSHLNGYKENEERFDVSQPLFSRSMKQADYETAWIGKWHLGSQPADAFDYWKILPGQGYYYNPDFINQQNDTARMDGYVTDIITELSTAWLDQRNPDKPFFLVVGEKATHREWFPDLQDLGAYDHVDFPLPETFYDDYKGRAAAANQDMTIAETMKLYEDLKVHVEYFPKDYEARKAKVKQQRYGDHELTAAQEQELERSILHGMFHRLNAGQKAVFKAYYDKVSKEFDDKNLKGDALTEWKFQRYMKDYLATANSLDRNIGRILDYLDEKGLAENTIVVYGSDQGFFLGEHGWFDKRFIYNESLKTPFFIRYPAVVKAGTVFDQQLLNIDWAPTLLEIAGLPVADDIQGKSFLPILKASDQSLQTREATYYHYYEFPEPHHVYPHFGITTDRYKLVRFYEAEDYWELYDLANDPNEVNNLYEDTNYKSLVEELKDSLAALIKEYKDEEAQAVLSKEL